VAKISSQAAPLIDEFLLARKAMLKQVKAKAELKAA